jgi:hypothetical protein
MTEVLALPRRHRAAVCSRKLNQIAIECLSGIQTLGGDHALDQAVHDLMLSVAAIWKVEHGEEGLAALLDQIERLA